MENKIEEIKKVDNKIIISEYIYTQKEVSEEHLVNVYNDARSVIEDKKKQIEILEEDMLEIDNNIAPIEEYLIDNNLIEPIVEEPIEEQED